MTQVVLAPGEQALVGYGSLLLIASMERTLGRKYEGPWHICHLKGWRRGWDVQMPHPSWKYREDGRVMQPERVLYLNIRRQECSSINCSLFVIQDQELARFDEREWIYRRLPVNDDLAEIRVSGGSAWVYVALDEFVWKRPSHPPEAIIRRTYLDILDRAQAELGPEFHQEYLATTDEAPAHLIVDDFQDG